MPRQSRSSKDSNAASVDALDDLDLDGMFTGKNDSLLDDIGMEFGDFGTMADAPLGTVQKKKGTEQNASALDDMQFDLFAAIPEDDVPEEPKTAPKTASTRPGIPSPPAPSSNNNSSNKPATRRRKRKTKSTTIILDEPEEDDDEATQTAKRKRRLKKGKSKKNNSGAATDSTVSATSPTTSQAASIKNSKSKKGASATSFTRGVSEGVVARPGQFGGRDKRPTYPPLARSQSERPRSSSSKNGSSNYRATGVGGATGAATSTGANPASVTTGPGPKRLSSSETSNKRNRNLETPKPLETTFCGLSSSARLR